MINKQGYSVFFRAPTGLPEARGKNREQILRENQEAGAKDFLDRMEQLTAAGVLEGITIRSKMQFAGVLLIDGPENRIEKLKNYLEDNDDIGTLCKIDGEVELFEETDIRKLS